MISERQTPKYIPSNFSASFLKLILLSTQLYRTIFLRNHIWLAVPKYVFNLTKLNWTSLPPHYDEKFWQETLMQSIMPWLKFFGKGGNKLWACTTESNFFGHSILTSFTTVLCLRDIFDKLLSSVLSYWWRLWILSKYMFCFTYLYTHLYYFGMITHLISTDIN